MDIGFATGREAADADEVEQVGRATEERLGGVRVNQCASVR